MKAKHSRKYPHQAEQSLVHRHRDSVAVKTNAVVLMTSMVSVLPSLTGSVSCTRARESRVTADLHVPILPGIILSA